MKRADVDILINIKNHAPKQQYKKLLILFKPTNCACNLTLQFWINSALVLYSRCSQFDQYKFAPFKLCSLINNIGYVVLITLKKFVKFLNLYSSIWIVDIKKVAFIVFYYVIRNHLQSKKRLLVFIS